MPSPAKSSPDPLEKGFRNDAGGEHCKPAVATPVGFLHKKENESLTSARTTNFLAAKHLLYKNEGDHLHRASYFGDERALKFSIDEIRRVKEV